jgi:hypothetical protein
VALGEMLLSIYRHGDVVSELSAGANSGKVQGKVIKVNNLPRWYGTFREKTNEQQQASWIGTLYCYVPYLQTIVGLQKGAFYEFQGLISHLPSACRPLKEIVVQALNIHKSNLCSSSGPVLCILENDEGSYTNFFHFTKR